MNLEYTRIILASQSPRRRELLSKILPEFEVIPSFDEEKPRETRPSRVVMDLARMKAADVFKTAEKTTPKEQALLVIGADTIVYADGEILGKPTNSDDAANMIRRLSGKDHEVFTGAALFYRPAGSQEIREKVFFEQTTVTFAALNEEEIKTLSSGKEPLDKAGAYAIQGSAGIYITRINGDIMNVIGLPVPRLYQELKALVQQKMQP